MIHPDSFRCQAGLRVMGIALFFYMVHALTAQTSVPSGQTDLFTTLSATGKSTGHIADLTIVNDQNTVFQTTLPAAMIPSDGMTQGFVIPQPVECSVPAFGQTTFRINGYCIDRALPVPPVGKVLHPPHSWRRLPHMEDNPFEKNPIDSIRPHTKTDSSADDPMGAKAIADGGGVSSAPGSLSKDAIGSESAHTAHFRGKYVSRTPEEEARLLDEVGKILRSVDSLQQKGVIKTPMSNHPPVEKNVITQQTIWVASSPPDQLYTMADICEDLEETWQSIPGSGPPAPVDKVAVIDAIFKAGSGSGISSFLPRPLPSGTSTPRSLPSSGHPAEQTITATGTGRTTGHIADITIRNPTDQPVMVRIGTGQFYIPSSGQYQPYIVPDMPPVALGPKETKTVPVYGYCVDIHAPPVPSGTGMPDIRDWTSVPGPMPDDMPENIVTIPTRIAPPVDDALRMITNHVPPVLSGADPDCIPYGSTSTPVPLIPGTSLPLPDPGGFSVADDASLLAPVLFTTLQRITDAYDRLRRKGDIKTPFSGHDVREREAVIQQTFWMYTGGMEGEGYEKKDFLETTVRQFEDNTQRDFESLPSEQKDQIESGVNDFWNSFQAVGVEAKVIRVPDPPAASDLPQTWDRYPSTQQKQTPPPVSSADDRTTSPVVSPVETPLVPPEAEPECLPQITMEAAPAMQGGLNPNSVGTFRIARGELIPLVAEGADADQIIFNCIPKNGCPESGSQRREGLTSEVRFEWYVKDGDAGLVGRFGGGSRKELHGKCALLALPEKSAAAWAAGFTDFYSLHLVILDAMLNQPLDAASIQEVTVVATREAQSKDDSISIMVIGNPFSIFKNPERTVSSGTCNAEPLGWEQPSPLSIYAYGNMIESGEKGILVAEALDFDQLTLRCNTSCTSNPKMFQYSDEVIFHWEILGEAGWFLEGTDTRVRHTYGKSVVFLAPTHHGKEPLDIPVRIKAYNQGGGQDPYQRTPLISKANDPADVTEITVSVPCVVGKNTSPAEVLIGWTDHFLDHDIPDKIETLRHAKSAIPVEIRPQLCDPRPATETSVNHPQLEDLAPGNGNIWVSERDLYHSGNTLYVIDVGTIIDAGVIQPSDDYLKSLRILVDIYAYAAKMGIASGHLPLTESATPLPSPLPVSQSWSERAFWFQTVLFEAMLKSWKDNENHKANDMGLVVSIWAVTSSRVQCDEACPASVEHVTMMSLGDEDHYYVRNSDVMVTTYVNHVPKTEVFSFRTEKKGPGHPE